MTADLTIKEFLSQLAAKQPTPGGGSASALGGAIGTALASMAANYTIGNEKYQAFDKEARKACDNLDAIRARLVELADADISAYQAYRAAVAMPKNTPEEKSTRSQAMTATRELATKIPVGILTNALDALLNVDALSRAANPNLAGDISSAAYFLEACARGAAIQIYSNCATNDEQGVNAAIRKTAAGDVAKCQALREKIDIEVFKMLKIES